MLLYRFLISIFASVVLVSTGLREGRSAVAARLGIGGPRNGQARLWLHAASNGELASARPVIEALRKARPDLPILVTCNTETGCDLARKMGLEARLAPLDLRWIVARFLRDWQVAAHITLESEIWPNRILRMPGPVIVLGARLTERSARKLAASARPGAHASVTHRLPVGAGQQFARALAGPWSSRGRSRPRDRSQSALYAAAGPYA